MRQPSTPSPRRNSTTLLRQPRIQARRHRPTHSEASYRCNSRAPRHNLPNRHARRVRYRVPRRRRRTRHRRSLSLSSRLIRGPIMLIPAFPATSNRDHTRSHRRAMAPSRFHGAMNRRRAQRNRRNLHHHNRSRAIQDTRHRPNRRLSSNPTSSRTSRSLTRRFPNRPTPTPLCRDHPHRRRNHISRQRHRPIIRPNLKARHRPRLVLAAQVINKLSCLRLKNRRQVN